MKPDQQAILSNQSKPEQESSMGFTDIAPPPAPKPPGTGISFGFTVLKSKQVKVRITLRADVQNDVFGGAVAGKTFSAQAGRGADEGRLRLTMDPAGQLKARAGMKDSAYIYMAGWDLLPKDKRPSASCEFVPTGTKSQIDLTLPDYCCPSGKGGKIATEFALKPIKAG